MCIDGWPIAKRSSLGSLGRRSIPRGDYLVKSIRSLTAFACGLRFPLLDFVMEVLKTYNVAPSQLHSNC